MDIGKVNTAQDSIKALRQIGGVPFVVSSPPVSSLPYCHNDKPSVDASSIPEESPLLDTCKQVDSVPAKTGESKSDLSKWESKRKRAEAVSAALDRVGLTGRAEDMAHCGTIFVERICKGCGRESRHRAKVLHCEDKLCPLCASRRAGRLAAGWQRGYDRFVRDNPGLHPYFVTLTFVDSDSLLPYRDYTQALKRLRRHPFWDKYRLAGGLACFETKLGKRSGLWHSHWHLCLWTEHPVECIQVGAHAGKWQVIVNQELAEAWADCTGGQSYIVRGMEFDGNMREVVKYMAKSVELLPDSRLFELARWGKGKRSLITFGALYDNPAVRAALEENPEEPECCCPDCGGIDFELHVIRWDSKLQRGVLDKIKDYRAPVGVGSG